MSVENGRPSSAYLNRSFYVAKAAASHFKQQGSSSYVNMTSTSGLINHGRQVLAANGVAGLSKSIALDMAKFNVGQLHCAVGGPQ
jgi:NAD(P)-dependent dehydrogenase (short-subunit alcohol dehydrogenase family)